MNRRIGEQRKTGERKGDRRLDEERRKHQDLKVVAEKGERRTEERRQKKRRVNFVPSYMNSWYQVLWSEELKVGQVKRMFYFGKELVAFRAENGQVSVLDAYCPHLGAHLGHGGFVKGDALVCPFHQWAFNNQGECVDVPYAKNPVSKKAKIHCWPVCEKNGMVFVYHGDGEPKREIPDLPEYHDPMWTKYAKSTYVVRSQTQEMGENIVDRAHFKYVHGTHTVPETSMEITDEGVLHVFQVSQKKALGKIHKAEVEIWCYSPGYSVVRFDFVTDLVLSASTIPIDENFIEQRMSFMASKKVNWLSRTIISKAVIAEINRQFREDLPIWENKIFLPNPVLCDGDGPLIPFRKWYRNFYPSWVLEKGVNTPEEADSKQA